MRSPGWCLLYLSAGAEDVCAWTFNSGRTTGCGNKKTATSKFSSGFWVRFFGHNVEDVTGFYDDSFDVGYGGQNRGRATFEEMKTLDSRLSKLEQSAPETLLGFYEPELFSFSVRPGGAKRFSITSSMFALQTLVSSTDPSLFASKVNFDMTKKPFIGILDSSMTDRIPLRNVLQAALSAEWRKEDLFQVPLILYTILCVDTKRQLLSPGMDEELAAKVRSLVTAVLNARPTRRSGNSQSLSDYLIFLIAQALVALHDTATRDVYNKGIGGLPTNALPEGALSNLLVALERCAEVGFNELCRQLAYRAAHDSSFDIMRLVYSLLTYVSASKSLASSGSAGREVVPGEGPLPGTVVTFPNQNLVKAALSAFFAEQTSDGLWRKGQPIYKSFRRTGREVGNAFVFSLDTLGSLLQLLPAEDFRPHMEAFKRTLTWIETHQVVEVLADYCDSDTGECFGKPLRGWSSPHLDSDMSLAWSTAQTLTCVSRMKRTVRELMHNDVLREFGGIQNFQGVKSDSWNRLLDSDLGDCGTDNCRTLKDVLQERIITPFSHINPSQDTSSQNGIPYPGPGACYSCILFGPPGTAKTTVCEAVANYMGWDFLVIDTAAFLADGLTNVAARIRYVFEHLQSLEKCVILFDEIEEFCLNRETPGLGMQSRMLTTAMLTAINDLRRAKRSIFFLATNRLRALDSAITRPGRFDIQLFVGTPNLESRCIQFRARLASLSVSEEVTAGALSRYRSFLKSVWSQDAMFMNYLEGFQFASSCAELVVSSPSEEPCLLLTNESMASILRSQTQVMTVKGQVRDEYIASMQLSRL